MNSKQKFTLNTFIALTLFFLSCGDAVKPEDITIAIPENIVQEKIGSFPAENFGYIIYDVAEEKVVKAHNSRKVFIPASVTKIFTALYTLENYKADDTYSTRISYTGTISKGLLKGNIFLKGSGDPELSIPHLVDMAKKIKTAGITAVEGSFIFDESLFPKKEMIDVNMSPEARYNTGLSALTLNKNSVYSAQIKNSEGLITGYSLIPSIEKNRAATYSGKPTSRLIRYSSNSGIETWSFPDRRAIPRYQLPVKDPAPFTAWTLKLICTIHGITLPSPEPGITPANAKELYTHKSTPITGIVKDMLHSSNNTTAELAAVTSIIKETGEYSESMEPVESFFKKNFTGISWDGLVLSNGSGLTPDGRISPEQTASVLIYADRKKPHSRELDYYLPMSGWEGTMMQRLDSPETAFRVYGKTGTIFYASALAGFFYSNSGKKYIFSIFISDINKRSEHDNNQKGLPSDTAEAVSWSKKAVNAIDEFLINQINEL